MPLPAPLHRLAQRPLPVVAAAGYLLLFLLVDWASFIRPLAGLNITPWNPQPALAVALLMLRPRLWWLVLVALAAAEIVVRGVPGHPLLVAAGAAALAGCYAAMARGVARLPGFALGQGWREPGLTDVLGLFAVVAVGALASGLAYIGLYTLAGRGPDGPWLEALGRYWIGDAVGLTVTLPILLVAADAAGRQRLREVLTSLPGALIGLALLTLVALLFIERTLGFSLAYLLLLPAIAAAVRFGAAGAVLACGVMQLGLIAAVQGAARSDRTVFELQLLLVAVTATALVLAVVVEERARADAARRRHQRQAAAGQVSAALAHELAQPLNALALYASAARQLAGRGHAAGGGAPVETALDPARQRQLLETVERMAADAHRAGEIVRRLRDFFRGGGMRLEPVHLAGLLAEAAAAQQRRAADAGVRLTLDTEPPGADTAVWADRVQLALVLRNLLDNAIDAAAEAPPGRRWVRASLTRHDDGVRLDVRDGGTGLDEAAAGTVFEAGTSGKPGGMGIGLGLSRAIAEAHGGRLWARPGDGGHFVLTLPRQTEPDDARDAQP